MSKEQSKLFMIVGSVLGGGGLVLLFSSVNLGRIIAETWLINRGGADTAYYHLIVESYINCFIVTGAVFLGSGMLMMIFGYYHILILGRRYEQS